MGNEGSQLGGLEISQEVIEVTNSWSLKHATNSSTLLSLFISQAESSAQLEIAAKKLKVYRHPGIVKYADTWKQGGVFHLATERVTPLAQVLPSVSPLQACLGLRSVLRALVFLHETAKACHNNVCCASIYVAQDGTWKLGNFEFVRGFSEISPEFLRESRARRYQPALAPEEERGNTSARPQAGDTFAFGKLVQEVLKNKDTSGDLCASEFLSLASSQLTADSPDQRGDLATLLEHPFFSHPVVAILEFLSSLTLKSADEKEQFFRSLWVQLATLPEVMVATQLADLLLSRLVLLESSAQSQLLPWLLAVRQDDNDAGSIQTGECVPLFSRAVFEKHVAPRIVRIFQVHDSQVRSVLLRHFHGYCHAFTKHQLQFEILPELLVGIKDNSDGLVAATLRALADLVPLLGAATVVGGKRGKLFTDGRPKVRPPRVVKAAAMPLVAASVKTDHLPDDNNSDGETNNSRGLLPERLSPDGGEAWSDWDDQPDEPTLPEPSSTNEESVTLLAAPPLVKPISNDLDCLDVKMAKITAQPTQQEVDFFQDMEPVISSPRTLLLPGDEGEVGTSVETPLVSKPEPPSPLIPRQDKFKVEGEEAEEGGWGDDEFLEWGSNDEESKPMTEVST